MKRACVFTGNLATDKVKLTVGHNWAREIPVSKEYAKKLSERLPTELELEAVEAFYALEVCQMRVDVQQRKLDDLRKQLYNQGPVSDDEEFLESIGAFDEETVENTDKKEKEIEKAYEQAEIQEKCDIVKN